MTKTDELLREFAEKWGCKYFDDGIDYGYTSTPDAQKRILSDLRTLIDNLMPTDEEIVDKAYKYIINIEGMDDKAISTGFLLGTEWLRSRLTEKPNNSERQMWRDIQEGET